VRLSGKGDVLFRQDRIGQHGEAFELFKLRTMLPSNSSDTQWLAEERVTMWGSLLRRTAVDELPQLYNVLRGDMSLVGPRPERPAFVDQFEPEIPGYTDRHRMPAGLTGLAQIVGLRGNTSIAERIKYDNIYIDQWSFWSDIQILFKTLFAVLRQGSLSEEHLELSIALEDLGVSAAPADDSQRGERIYEAVAE
jgi:lipopolysaccharide/colanic/teichoic acid biosynthesis glycosyltransferase